MARRKVVYVADGKDAATVDAFAAFLERHGGRRENITDASIDMGAAFIAGVRANFPNVKITFDKFHVIKLVNEAVDEVRRGEARHNDWIKGTRYLWLKNLQNLDEEEKASIVRLEAANLDTMQAWQIPQNLQDVFTMPERSESASEVSPSLAGLGQHLRPPADEESRRDDHGQGRRNPAVDQQQPLQWPLEAINGNVQAAKRTAKGYRDSKQHNLEADGLYLVEGGVLTLSPT